MASDPHGASPAHGSLPGADLSVWARSGAVQVRLLQGGGVESGRPQVLGTLGAPGCPAVWRRKHRLFRK